jgi:hypothetical protein
MSRLGALVLAGLALFGSGLATSVAGEDNPVPRAPPALALSATGAEPPRPGPIPRPAGVPRRTASLAPGLAPSGSPRPPPRDSWDMPALRWDGHPRGPRWTAAVMSALRGPGAPLLDVVPRDIAQWCPAYPEADDEQRAAFRRDSFIFLIFLCFYVLTLLNWGRMYMVCTKPRSD